MSISGVFPVGALTGYANPYCCVLLRLGPQSGPNRMWVALIGEASMSPTQEEFLAELERLGVGAVRERIATNVYLGGLRDIAQGWADRKSKPPMQNNCFYAPNKC